MSLFSVFEKLKDIHYEAHEENNIEKKPREFSYSSHIEITYYL